MNLNEADRIAAGIVERLAPWCEPGYCEVGGSIRRRRPECGDIEIVCIPRRETMRDLFGTATGAVTHPGFCAAVDDLGVYLRGQAAGKYACRIMDDGTQVDIFMARRDNWGLILAIRTGGSDYSRRLMIELRARGLVSRDGMIRELATGRELPAPDERTVFAMAGMPCRPPEARE